MITIDASGRVVIPKDVRDRHGLGGGARLTLVDLPDKVLLVPAHDEPRLVERNGLLVVAGPRSSEIPDHRDLREERLAGFESSE